MPTHNIPSPPHTRENRTRFKNLYSRASNFLDRSAEISSNLKDSLRTRLLGLLDDLDFWTDQADGLAVFATANKLEYFHLPLECDEYVAIDSQFHLLPLIGLLPNLVDFYVLTISQKQPVLFKGDAYGLERSEIILPASVRQDLRIDEMVQEREGSQFHSIAGGAGAEWHGHGGIKDAGTEERMLFFKHVDDILFAQTNHSMPIVLAGTDSEVEEYRQLSRYPNILSGYLHGSYQAANPNEIFRPACDIIDREVIQKSREKTIENYRSAHKLVASDITDVKSAAEAGRVDTLLIPSLLYTTDTVQDNTEPIPKIAFLPSKQMVEVDYIARQSWRQGGKVSLLDRALMPSGDPVAAILRY
jgi:hypothetical protein